MDGETDSAPHPALRELRTLLHSVHEAISNHQPYKPPILDSSIDVATSEGDEDGQWTQLEHIAGLKKLRDSVKIDLDVLDKFLDDPSCVYLPPLSTNAPYLIAVWNEVLCAPTPVDAIFKSMLLEGPAAEQRRRGAQRPAAKVDVIADNGRRWIRVNTVKNSRLLAEFREIDSYITDSDDSTHEDSADAGPSLVQTEFDNSVLRMGRSLLAAAEANPIEASGETPKVTLRLTRLDPSQIEGNGQEADPRIGGTIRLLQEMGIDVKLGESIPPPGAASIGSSSSPSATPSLPLEPTLNVNLDLSVLIALISDLSHAPLPETVEEADRRFMTQPQFRAWKQAKSGIKTASAKPPSRSRDRSLDRARVEADVVDELPKDLAKQSQALINQLLQEMGRGLIQEMHDRVAARSSSVESPTAVKFWTTPEARDRCLRIVSKIGGPSEKRRALALLSSVSHEFTEAVAEKSYWQDSRHPYKFLALFPINIYPPATIPDIASFPNPDSSQPLSRFSRLLAKTCGDILAQETMPHPRALPDELTTDRQSPYDAVEIQRATVTRANPRLTAHTVLSLLWGAELGWTTLTANKTSIKAVLREIKLARIAGRLDGISTEDPEQDDTRAAIWIVDPRSLSEGMYSLG